MLDIAFLSFKFCHATSLPQRTKLYTVLNPILHGLFWAGWSRGDRIHHAFLTLVLFDGFELNLVQ